MAEAAQFGEESSYLENQRFFLPRDRPFNSYVILFGQVRTIDSSTGTRRVFVRYGAGRFTGDIDLLIRRSSLPTCEAETAVETIRLSSNQLRVPGVLAAGDCRRGRTVRVAFAVGDGALAVTSIHSFLGRTQPTATMGTV